MDVSANRRSADFFRQACQEVMEVIGVRAMGAVLCRDRRYQLPILCGEAGLLPAQVQRLAEQLLLSLRQHQGQLVINRLAGLGAYQWLVPFASQLIAVPLKRGEQILGCLFGLDKAQGEFDAADAKLLATIANESAICLENAMLYSDMRDLMMGLLHSLTSAVDAKDTYTRGHSERVALISRHLAARIGLPDSEVESVYIGGLLHDVGKIGVPESVLHKAGALNAAEFQQITRHPEIGARILSDIRQIEMVVPGVLHHHERYDGRGYPAGLAGRDIPLIGRIISLADCLDAMTSHRNYRRALPLEVALAEIHRCAGSQFDPDLTAAFLAITPDEFRMLLSDRDRQKRRLLELHQALRAA